MLFCVHVIEVVQIEVLSDQISIFVAHLWILLVKY